MLHFCRRVYWFIERRVVNKQWFYPKAVKSQLPSIGTVDTDTLWHFQDQLESELPSENGVTPDTISIASGRLRIEPTASLWQQQFDDQEDTFSIHRWNFLLTLASDSLASDSGDASRYFSWCNSSIDSWIVSFLDKQEGHAWTTYTTGERICNGIIFYALHNKAPEPRLVEAFLAFGRFIANNLEYKGQTFTGNHVINNARALYFCGQVLGRTEFSRLSRSIFSEELPGLVTADGFLREGSSHYQFLFTRWIIEVYWVACITGDREFSDSLAAILPKLHRSCRFFLIHNPASETWSIPLFGDVSPDFTPSWLIGLPWCSIFNDAGDDINKKKLPSYGLESSGWTSIMQGLLRRSTPEVLSTEAPSMSGKQVYNDSGWYRIDHGDATLILRIEPQGTPDFPGHGHNDIASFVLYISGKPVVIDPGRSSYQMDPLSRYGVSAKSHNTLLINGFEPFPFLDRRSYPRQYRCRPAGINVDTIAEGYNITIDIPGFSRLSNAKVKVNRTLRVREGSLTVVDEVEGTGIDRVEARFHFSPDITIEKGAYGESLSLSGYFGEGVFGIEDPETISVVRGDNQAPAGWYFPQYGQQEECSTVIVNRRAPVPGQTTYRLEWN